MTDNDIIKALECCVFKTTDKCDKCILTRYGNDCKKLGVYALDLINRQKELIEKSERVEHFADKTIATLQAEIERLKGWERLLKAEKHSLIKAEAVKEFAEKVQTEIKKALESNYKARAEKEKEEFNKYLDNLFWNYCTGKIDCLRGIDDFIDNLLKETVGDAK